MTRINLMFLMISLNVGGTERHVIDVATHLDRRKFKVVVCCLHSLGSLGNQFVANETGIKVYSNLIKNKYDLFGLKRIMRIIKDERIHILYTINSPLTQSWGTLLAKLSGMNALVSRVATTKTRFHGKRRSIVNKLTMFFVDKIIAQADTHKEYLTRIEGIQREKIEVIYNGVEPERFIVRTDKEELKRILGVEKYGFVIGIVARLAPEKGHSVFLKAAKEIMHTFPDICFIIVGDGNEQQRLKVLTRDLGIESRVFFLGTRNDIPEVLSIFDIAVLSSDQIVETVSNAVLEYMAAGLPVVATNAGSTCDLVDDGKTGYLISSGDAEGLAGALHKLLINKELARKMGEEGRDKVMRRFTVSKMIDNYESLFLRLMRESG